ncbi:MAG: GNAT family N-acetyltransferase [Magnetococcales bacterium]|nr:GNAT family N-acetyltransferase [Magnetococcales bacterium]
MIQTSTVIHSMSGAEMELAIEWAASEGWNPGLDDARCFHVADPQGFLLATQNDMPIAMISAVCHDDHFGFLGFYIVHPEFRGRGHGMKLWHAALSRLAQRNVGLDGVLEQEENYRRSGFVLAHRNQRYQGIGGGEAPAGVIDLATVPFQRLSLYDAHHFGRPRPSFLRHWSTLPGKAVMSDGVLKGYGVIRPCRVGHKIGPLFADSPYLAERLFQALSATVPGEPLFLDLPLPNVEALALAARHHMSPVFETARMYLRGDPALPLVNIYGITSFELG